eukprot:CAMPEP_0115663038 /NCGR_PEP_ID=MMETSP0272-20121206/47633_1 /TAXON_ID=71861 /ORGANISM="Scrippsiella trochoidea, Strain CCMP3099" /LENGTH=113 /DNA_ID=CAMNT_0003101371 /DNA_START=68 /DNA_END=409 /DNA_ORIENTATION=+
MAAAGVALAALLVCSMAPAIAAEEEEASPDDPHAILKEMDANKDGKLTYAEMFDSVMGEDDDDGSEEFKEDFKNRLEKHFKASDENGDGFLEVEEIRKLVAAFSADAESEEEL